MDSCSHESPQSDVFEDEDSAEFRLRARLLLRRSFGCCVDDEMLEDLLTESSPSRLWIELLRRGRDLPAVLEAEDVLDTQLVDPLRCIPGWMDEISLRDREMGADRLLDVVDCE